MKFLKSLSYLATTLSLGCATAVTPPSDDSIINNKVARKTLASLEAALNVPPKGNPKEVRVVHIGVTNKRDKSEGTCFKVYDQNENGTVGIYKIRFDGTPIGFEVDSGDRTEIVNNWGACIAYYPGRSYVIREYNGIRVYVGPEKKH